MMSIYLSEEDIYRNLVTLKQVVFEVTEACNLSCEYCAYSSMYDSYAPRNNKKMPFAYAKNIIDYLSSLWIKNDSTKLEIAPTTTFGFYGGEPLLNINLIARIIDYIESLKLNRKIQYAMTTNATLLNQCMDYLVEKDFTLLVSLDGDKEANAYRVTKDGNSSFEQVFENLILCKKKYPSFFENNINFNTVLQDKSSIDKIVSFFLTNFGKIPRMGEINPYHIDPDYLSKYQSMYRSKKDCLSRSQHRAAISKKIFLEDPYVNQVFYFLRYHSGNFFSNYKDLFLDVDSVKRTITGTCTPFMLRMFVTSQGKILPCEKISHDFSYGTVEEKGVDLNVADVAKQYNEYIKTIEKQCFACKAKDNCSQCIYDLPNQNGSFCCSEMVTEKSIERYRDTCFKYLQEHPYLYRQLLENTSFV